MHLTTPQSQNPWLTKGWDWQGKGQGKGEGEGARQAMLKASLEGHETYFVDNTLSFQSVFNPSIMT